ncbi:MAG: hypothetical protein AAGF12_13730 [Myxococcota bacterium]
MRFCGLFLVVGLLACAEGGTAPPAATSRVTAPKQPVAIAGSRRGTTPRFRAQVTVGVPATQETRETSRFRAGIGVGPFVLGGSQ